MGITKLLAACAIAVLGLAGTAFGQDAYPSKPLRLIVPYPPGGTTDILARIIAQKLGNALRQPVVVDNRPGANGSIGSEMVALAEPDGYTLLMGSAGPLTINPSLYSKLRFDPSRDFAPISLVAEVPLVVVVNPKVPATSVRDLIGLAKARPSQLTFASSGNGSTQHLAGELFKTMAGVDMRHIPYKGAAGAMTDLLGGRVDMMIDLTPTASPHIASGGLRALAGAGLERLAAFPDLPTVSESGLKGFDVSTWFGILSPARTPEPVITMLNREIAAALNSPDVRKTIVDRGAEPKPSSPVEFAALIRKDLAKWGKVVSDSKAQID